MGVGLRGSRMGRGADACSRLASDTRRGLNRLGMSHLWRNTTEGKDEVDWRSHGHHGGELPGRQQSSNYGLERATTDYGCPS